MKKNTLSTLRTALFCMLLFCACLLSGCGDKTMISSPMDAQVSFTPTLYLSDTGLIRFVYDCDRDMLSTMEGYDLAALYSGGDYSLVVSYVNGPVARKDADEQVRTEFSAGADLVLSRRTTKTTVSGYPFRRAEITCSDGSVGAVCYGSTKTGFAELYYIISPDAPADTLAHVEEILSSVVLGEFPDNYEEEVKIFYDGAN